MATKTSLSSTGTLTLSDIGSVYFDGSGDSLTVPGNTAFQFAGNCTIEFWVYFNSITGIQRLVGNYITSASPDWMIVSSTGTINWFPSTGINNVNAGFTVSPNVWYHIAAVRNGSTCSLYINGISVGTPATQAATLGDTTRPIYVGSNAGTSDFLNGYISNLRIVKGTAVYTGNFIPSTVPLTPVNNTQLLTCQGPVIKDASANNFTVTINNASYNNLSPFRPFLKENVIESGSIFFDGGSNVVTLPNSSQFTIAANQDFTLEAWVYLSSSRSDYAYMIDFIGDASYILQLRIGNAGFGYRVQAAFGPGASAGSVYNNASYTQTNLLNKWTHLAICRSGDSATFFFDGVGIETKTGVGSISFSNVNTARLGRPSPELYHGYISNVRFVIGSALYPGNFSPSRSLQLVPNTQLLLKSTTSPLWLKDDSINNFTLTTIGSPTYSSLTPETSILNYKLDADGITLNELDEVSMLSRSILFDGVDDFVTTVASASSDLGTISTSTNFTFDCWARWNVVNSNYRIIAVHAVSGSGGNGKGGWAISERSGILEFNISKTSSVVNPWYVSFTTNQSVITTATWNHIAFVIASGVPKFYVNGLEAPSTFNTSAALYSSTLIGFDTTRTDYGVRVGASYTDSTNLNPVQFFSGNISNLRIVNGTALYTGNFTPQSEVSDNVPNTSLLLNCFSGQEFTDSSSNNFTLTRNGLIAASTLNPFSITTSTAQKLFYDGTIMVREFVES